MKKYVGTKTVKAEPMNELAAEERGYARKNEDNHEWREGYHVQYTNPDGSIYNSWSPKSVFEKAYQVAETPLDRMNIEYKEESERFEKGEKFINSMNFDKLNYLAKTLLSAQNKSQREYCYLLWDRIAQMSDKKVLLNGYDFGTAIKFLKAGGAIRRAGWNGKDTFVIKQVPNSIKEDVIPNMQSLPQIAKDILMSRNSPHIDYTNQMLIINPDGRADSWVPSSSDVFAEDWELVTE
nr:MAG TPA: Protein of unknown function (DUF2829) [Caudoviricetes sp.]